MERKYGVGIIGYGYWGPNLARNFSSSKRYELISIIDTHAFSRKKAKELYPNIQITDSLDEALADPALDLIVIATPVSTHYSLAKKALLSGKHVLVEKPITAESMQAIDLCKLAGKMHLMIAVDHTFLYTPAVLKIKEIIDSGELGNLLYIDSIRANLGLFQHDVDVIWDLAPHDVSIVSYLLNKFPSTIMAMGKAHTPSKLVDVCYLHMEYNEGPIVHVNLNWLAPAKVRQMVIVGTEKMLVFNDLEIIEKIRVYDKGVNFEEMTSDSLNQLKVQYRLGDIKIPQISGKEALAYEIEYLAECLDNSIKPISDGFFGIKICEVLEAADQSLAHNSSKVEVIYSL